MEEVAVGQPSIITAVMFLVCAFGLTTYIWWDAHHPDEDFEEDEIL
jgi:hypothetical protein